MVVVNTYLLLLAVAMCVSLILTPVVSRISQHFGWLDTPRDGRRMHGTPLPRLGGVAVFVALLAGLTPLLVLNNPVSQVLRTHSAELLRVLLPGVFIFLIGLYDDFRGTNARAKFAAQALAALLFCALGGRIEAISVPLFGSIELHPVIGYALTVLWTVGICNAFNLIDGMDGLASGAALSGAIVMVAVSLMLGHPLVTIMAVVLCGALIGFLPYNFNPASIFLGDSGSLFTGFMLAALAVQGAQKASTAVGLAIPLLAFGVPVADTVFSMVRRSIGGKPLFKGDREHIHHMLLARGWTQRRVTLALYVVCGFFGLAALTLAHDSGTQRTGPVLFVVGAVVVAGVGRLRYHEVDEVRAGMRRSFSERRARIANNVRMRRASRLMSKASTLNEIFSATQEMLEAGEFVYATMQLGHKPSERCVSDISHCEEGYEESERLLQPENVNGPVNWTWQRGNIEAREIVGSSRCWTLRLPLATTHGECGYLNLSREFGGEVLLLDMNYLWDLFQRETANAVERVLALQVEAERPALLAAVEVVNEVRLEGEKFQQGWHSVAAVDVRVSRQATA